PGGLQGSEVQKIRRAAGRYLRGIPLGAGDLTQSGRGSHQCTAPGAAPAHRWRNGSLDDGGRAGRMRTGVGPAGSRRARYRQSCRAGAGLRPGSPAEVIRNWPLIRPLQRGRERHQCAQCLLVAALATWLPPAWAESWQMQYFYDEDKTRLVLNDLKF